MIIVAVIVAVLAAASVPRFARTAERFRSEQAVLALVQQLRYARDRAVGTGLAVEWIWDPAQRCGRLEALTPDGYAPLTDRFSRNRALPPALTATLTDQDDGRITFFQDGTSEPASLQLASAQRTYTITVDAVTGQITLATGLTAR